MNKDQVINVALTIEEIRYAAKVIRKDATQESEEATLSKLERVIEAYDYVAKREAKRNKEAEAREDEAVALLSGKPRAVYPLFGCESVLSRDVYERYSAVIEHLKHRGNVIDFRV